MSHIQVHDMKKHIIITTLLVATGAVVAQIFTPFSSWDYLTEHSRDIIIARCTTTPQPTGVTNGIIESDIEVISILKGSTKLGMSHMQSWYHPYQGERFLIFANFYSNSAYTAVESYQIVPLNRDFRTNDLAGKTLKEQIQIILNNRLKDLIDELARDNEEKLWLETTMSNNVPVPVPKPPLTGGHPF